MSRRRSPGIPAEAVRLAIERHDRTNDTWSTIAGDMGVIDSSLRARVSEYRQLHVADPNRPLNPAPSTVPSAAPSGAPSTTVPRPPERGGELALAQTRAAASLSANSASGWNLAQASFGKEAFSREFRTSGLVEAFQICCMFYGILPPLSTGLAILFFGTGDIYDCERLRRLIEKAGRVPWQAASIANTWKVAVGSPGRRDELMRKFWPRR